MRVGLGVDAHAFGPGRALVIGGVEIPDHEGLVGHSDADVVSHAVADALLGAAGLGDLGGMFPPTHRWKDVSSQDILKAVLGAVRAAGWAIVNVDATVVAQSPRLSPFIDQMRDSLSRSLELERGRVSIKATTSDHLGFTGRGEGIAAMAIALVQPLG